MENETNTSKPVRKNPDEAALERVLALLKDVQGGNSIAHKLKTALKV
jgi:hypothetical protein